MEVPMWNGPVLQPTWCWSIDEKSLSIDWVDSVRFTRREIPWNSDSETTSLCMHQNSSLGNLSKRYLFILIIFCTFILASYSLFMRKSWDRHNSLNFSTMFSCALACALWAGCPVQWSPWNTSKGHSINIRPSSYQLLYRSMCQTESNSIPFDMACYLCFRMFSISWYVVALL